jgi:drug/metabolite transporter (DMT)-like permease
MTLRIPMLILIVTLLWGYSWVTMKIGLSYMEPLTWSFWRFVAGTLTMFAILKIRKIKAPARREMPYLAVLGLFQLGLNYFCVMYGMKFVEAGKSSILFYTMPLFNLVLSFVFLKESISARKIAGVVTGFVGILVIMGWDFYGQRDLQRLAGEGLILCGALAFAIANMIVKKRYNGSNMVQINAWQMLFGTISILIAALLLEWGKPMEFNAVSVFTILFAGIFGGAVCFLGWYLVLAEADSTVAAMSILFVPVISLIFGWLQLGESVNLGVIIGMGLIAFGIYLVHSIKDKRRITR